MCLYGISSHTFFSNSLSNGTDERKTTFTMKTLKLLVILLVVTLSTNFYSCTSQSSDSIVGTWKEYRDDSDDYLLSTIKFNEDGTGLFTVQGMTNTQKFSFTWEKTDASTIKIDTNGNISTFELNNGLLIEHSSFGSIIYKKKFLCLKSEVTDNIR